MSEVIKKTASTIKDKIINPGDTNPEKSTLERQGEIIEEQKKEIEELKKLKPKNSDDIAPGIRKTDTFKGGYRNGYEDGTVAKAIKADKEKQSKEMQVAS